MLKIRVEKLPVKIIIHAQLNKYWWEISFEELHVVEELLLANYHR
jgi:hypothetical protein